MRRPPRNPRQRLFTARLMLRSMLQGLGALAAALLVLIVSLAVGLSDPDVRALTFATLIVTNLALIFSNRSVTNPIWSRGRRPNPALLWLAAGALAVLAAILYVPLFQDLFRVTRPHANDAAVIVAAGAGAVLWMEAVKAAMSRGVGRART